ncbi:MAG: hypothetical protein M0001_06215 [Treponema sp.]|nr:hypothetical protein [Treponema sp.]
MKASSRRGLVARISFPVAAALALLLFVSCASGPPEILGVEWTIESRPAGDSGNRSPHGDLAVFARVHDTEGMDDIEAMWILNDAAELCWTLGPSSWMNRRLGSDDWLGATGLSMPDGSAPPPGRYRAVVADLAGDRAVYEFTIDKVRPDAGLPAPEWKGGRVSLAGAWPENYLLAYDAAGGLLRSVVMSAGGGSLAALAGSADAGRTRAIAVYGYDPAKRRGAFSKRIPIP